MGTVREPEQELLKRLDSRLWRLSNLYWIEDEQGRKVKFRPNQVQAQHLQDMWWLNVILKSRQHGMSTLISIMQLDECLFNPNHTCGIIDKTDDDAKKKLAKMRFAYDHLDDTDDMTTAQLGAAVKEAVPIVRANDHELQWKNSSKVWSGVSLRGGTVQFLHISELGYIGYYNPKKAEEIRSGALNTVHKGSKVVIESTHEGGKAGLNYEMIRIAQQNNASRELSQMDWKFHFYAWWQDPKNTLPLGSNGLRMTKPEEEYFTQLLEEDGIDLTLEQKHWYLKKQLTQKHAMSKEHPSTPEEAINAVVRGAIYGKIIAELRRNGRIKDFAHDPSSPIYTFWDLGDSDYTAIWLIQPCGPEFFILRHHSWFGEGARYYALKMAEWEAEYGPITRHYLPHDAVNHKAGVSWEKELKLAGLSNMKIVPRTPDKWIGINQLRSLLPRCYIHESGCSEEVWNGDNLIPSGIGALEGYHTKPVETGGRINEEPVHDETSHSCDAIRTFAEAHQRGMLEGYSKFARESRKIGVRVKTGLREDNPRRRVRVLR